MVPRPVIARIQIGTQVYASPAVYVKARVAAHADAWPVDVHANLTDLQCWPKRTQFAASHSALEIVQDHR